MKMYRYILAIVVMAVVMMFALSALADVGVVQPTDFASQFMSFAGNWKNLSWLGKISGILLLLVAATKVSVLKPVWDFFGKAKPWVVLGLGLLAGIFTCAFEGDKFSLAKAFAYMAAGGGAILLSELLELVKAIPGLGTIYVKFIEVIEGFLGAAKPAQLQVAEKPAAQS